MSINHIRILKMYGGVRYIISNPIPVKSNSIHMEDEYINSSESSESSELFESHKLSANPKTRRELYNELCDAVRIDNSYSNILSKLLLFVEHTPDSPYFDELNTLLVCSRMIMANGNKIPFKLERNILLLIHENLYKSSFFADYYFIKHTHSDVINRIIYDKEPKDLSKFGISSPELFVHNLKEACKQKNYTRQACMGCIDCSIL